MARPRHNLEFGSDSFLDVLTNVVGILIILIVIASTQLGRSPALRVPPPVDGPLVLPDPIVVSQPPAERLGENLPPPDIVRLIEAAEVETQGIEKRQAELTLGASQIRKSKEALLAELTARQVELLRQQDLLRERKLNVSSLAAAVNQARQDLKGVLAEFEATGKATPKVSTLKHSVTPISQLIEGPELHFRLAENRVSVIPLEELVGRVKTQIERQKEWLARHRRQEGSVGPVDGYSMKYLIEARSLSPLEELRHGQGLFRISMSRWEAVPEPDLDAETAGQALRRGSKFTRSIEAAAADTSLTFWVYPDSFGLYRKLQAEAHKAGFIVTGRPLPDGTPVAGSPSGTRSAGQ